MKFFISYSRSVKMPVGAVIDELAKVGHDVWWDGDIPVIADWWETILKNIEACQVFIFMISEKSVQSDYCLAELHYADALNKPILPFIIDDAIVDGKPRYPIPAEINDRRVQWLNYDGNIKGMLARIKSGCDQINWDFYQPVPQTRPPEPNSGAKSLTKQFQLAVSLAEEGHFDEAVKRLRNVARLESQRLGELCRLWELRITAYQGIAEYAESKATLKLGRVEWSTYVAGFQTEDDDLFDPFDLAARLIPMSARVPVPPPTSTSSIADIITAQMSIEEAEEVIGAAPPPADNAPDWLNAMVPGLDVDYEAQEDESEYPEYVVRLLAFTGKHNRDWQPYITTFPDLKIASMEFCLVPPGVFQMGSEDGDDNEKPSHSQMLSQPYWLAKYPVTNAQWRDAVSAGAVKPPEGESALKWYQDSQMANCPVVGVSWFDASQFCVWLGCRLPTEREWEYAARGVDNLVYSWGKDWDETKVVWNKNSGGKPNPVSSKPEGAAWVGALHLSGNVWEWTSSLYQPYPYQADDGREVDTGNRTNVWCVLRGGSWGSDYPSYLLAVSRGDDSPDYGGDLNGFRCVCSFA
jgi:formylglycine-generating enzyme required for sulfatase activity